MRFDINTITKVIRNFTDSVNELYDFVNKLESSTTIQFDNVGFCVNGKVMKGVTNQLNFDNIQHIYIENNNIYTDYYKPKYLLAPIDIETQLVYDNGDLDRIGDIQSLHLTECYLLFSKDMGANIMFKEQDIMAMLDFIENTPEILRILNIQFGDDIQKLNNRLDKLK